MLLTKVLLPMLRLLGYPTGIGLVALEAERLSYCIVRTVVQRLTVSNFQNLGYLAKKEK